MPQNATLGEATKCNKCSGMQQLSNSEVPLHVEDPPTSPVSELVFFEAWYMGQAGVGWNAAYVGGRLLKWVWKFGSSWSMFADLTHADLRVGLSGMIGMWWAPKNLQYWEFVFEHSGSKLQTSARTARPWKAFITYLRCISLPDLLKTEKNATHRCSKGWTHLKNPFPAPTLRMLRYRMYWMYRIRIASTKIAHTDIDTIDMF